MLNKYFIAIAGPLLMIAILQRERQNRERFFALLAGMFCLLVASSVNSLILKADTGLDFSHFVVSVTPVTEESLKFLTVYLFCVCFSADREGAIANAGLIGVGFALMENLLYLFRYPEEYTLTVTLARSIASGIAHGLNCHIMIMGIHYFRRRRVGAVSGTFAVLCFTITLHGFYNLLNQDGWSPATFLLMAVVYGAALLFRYGLPRHGEKIE